MIGGTDELWSYSGVALRFGDQAAEGLYNAMVGTGLNGAAQVYTSRGMQLNLPAVQDKLTAIALAIPALAAVCNALKEIGITHGTRWQLWGVDPVPEVEEIAAARMGPTEDQKIAHLMNEVITPYLQQTEKTLAGLIDAIATATGS